MAAEPRISTVAAAGVTGLIGACGGDTDRVLGAARLDHGTLGNPTARIGLASYCDLFEQAVLQTGVDHFGLRFGQSYRTEDMGPLGQIAINAPTLGAALRNLCAYFPAVQDHSSLVLREAAGLARLEYRILDGRITGRRQDSELSLGIFSSIFGRALGPGWSPEEVHFEHPRAAGAGIHCAAFNAPVYFGQSTNAILFRPAALTRKMPGADAALLPALHASLSRRGGAAQKIDFCGQVLSEIRAGFADGDPGIGAVAARLGMSRATLCRALAAEGSDFSRLTQGVRQALALLYIGQAHLPLTEIAACLGYSELSAFSRAFRKWTGVSPAEYRVKSGV